MANKKTPYVHRRISAPPVFTPVPDWRQVPVVFDIPMAARILGKHAEVVRRKIVAGSIPAIKAEGEWRIRKDKLMEYLGYLPWEIDKYGFGLNVERPH